MLQKQKVKIWTINILKQLNPAEVRPHDLLSFSIQKPLYFFKKNFKKKVKEQIKMTLVHNKNTTT